MRCAIVTLTFLILGETLCAQDRPILVPNTDEHTARVNRVRFTPDGRQLISVSNDKTIRIWNVNSGQPVRVLRPPIGPGDEGLLYALAVAPDGNTIAVGGYPLGGGRLGYPIYQIDLSSGHITRLLHGHKGPITDLAFSPDGQILASTSYDKSLRLWKIGSDEKEKILEGHDQWVTSVAWSPDGKQLVTGSSDGTARIWSLPDGQCDAVLRGHSREVYAVAWSRDGKHIATGGDDRSIRLWSPAGKPGKVFENLGNRITSLTFTNRSVALIVTRGGPETLDYTCSVLWHLAGDERIKFTKHSNTVMNGTLSPDGKLAATCGGLGHEIYIWQIGDGEVWNRLGGKARGALSAGWGSNGLLAWGQTNKGSTFQANLPLERAFQPASLEFADPTGGKFTRAELSRGNLTLSLGSTNRVDLRLGGDVLQSFKFADPSNRVRCFSFLTADRVVVGGTKSLEVFDAATGQCVRRLHGHSDEVWAVAPAPNRRFLLSASLDQTVRVWDAEALLRSENTGIGLTLRVDEGKLLVAGILPGTPVALDGRLREGDEIVGIAGRGSQMVPTKGRKIDEMTALINGPADTTIRLRVVPAGKNDPVEYDIQRQRPATRVGQIEPLFSLYYLSESKWLAWTPEGYYAASTGGEKMMGWHINNGTDRMATFLPAERVSRSLNRPDILMQTLETGSVERARALADLLRGTRSKPFNIVQVLPPKVKITSPAKSGTKVDEEEVEVTATAESSGEYPVTAMRLLLDGRPFQGYKGLKRFDDAKPGGVQASWRVPLTAGRHRLVVQADCAVSQGDSEPVEVSYVVDSPQQPGRLFVLAIGIAAYNDPNLKLYYGASDAQKFATRLKEKGMPLPYQRVEIKTLPDGKATRSAIREGLQWLQDQAKPNDSVCVFYSGHGERDAKGGLYLLPADVEVGNLEKTAISAHELKSALLATPGQHILLVLDACHAGASSKLLAEAPSSELAKDLGRDENGILVMCSSLARQTSGESNLSRQSFYTQALLEGLAGKGATASKDGIVYHKYLSAYVTDRVLELSKKSQLPTEVFPGNLAPFPLTRP